MKTNSIIGYSISIVGGILMIVSMFLSLTMTSFAKVLTQGDTLFAYLTSGITGHAPLLSAAIVVYLISAALAALLLISAIVSLILTFAKADNKILLLVQRIVALLVFVTAIVALILLGVYLVNIQAEHFNFIGFGIMVAVLASLLCVLGIFLAKPPKRKEENKEN